jgi:hypothetical protein
MKQVSLKNIVQKPTVLVLNALEHSMYDSLPCHSSSGPMLLVGESFLLSSKTLGPLYPKKHTIGHLCGGICACLLPAV